MYTRAVAVTPNDSTDLPQGLPKALWVGGAGNISLDDQFGNTTLISGIPAGTQLNLGPKRIRATSTTATLIVALY